MLVGFGPAARGLKGTILEGETARVMPSCTRFDRPGFDVVVVLFTPPGIPPALIVWTADQRIGVAVDGYFFVESLPSEPCPRRQAEALAETIAAKGLDRGLRSIVAGSYNLVVMESETHTYTIVNDHAGTIPLYYAPVERGTGFLCSTHPAALMATGLIPKDLDGTACAEWVYLGHTIGDRYFLKSVKKLRPCSLIQWSRLTRAYKIASRGMTPVDVLPSEKPVPVEEIVDRVVASCKRLAGMEGRTAHFQSAGLDSRFILAVWPGGAELPCITYGNPNSTEVMIAESLSRLRGSSFRHIWPHGDQVAESLDEMFLANGLLVYPDRFLIPQRLNQEGYRNITDGYLGDVLMGGCFYRSEKYVPPLRQCGRYLTLFADKKVSRIHLDRLSELLFREIVELPSKGYLEAYCTQDFAETVAAEKANVLQDLHDELRVHLPADDSVAVLLRNFELWNRSQHAVLQQGVMSRQHMRVLYPFAGDAGLLNLMFQVAPRIKAYKKLYIRLFRSCLAPYSKELYGSSMLPLRWPALLHYWAHGILSSPGLGPIAKRMARGRELSANNWPLWLQHSRKLRERIGDLLCGAGMATPRKLEARFSAIAGGAELGSGKLLHLASIAKWKSATC
jgi:hypothetical protein